MTRHADLPLLRTVRDVVDVLGGTSTTAERLDVSPSAVSIWLRKNRIPPARYLDVSTAIEQTGHRVERSLFRETPRQKSETHAA